MHNTDTQLLLKCRDLIAQKLSWPSSNEWRNYEFNELSEKILEETGIGLSTTTLKRVFGKVQYNNLPSSATLNALAMYLGYENWMHFKAQSSATDTPFAALMPERGGSLVTYKSFFLGVALVGLIVVSGFVFFQGKKANPVIDASGIVFNSRPLANGLPNSVLFNIDLKDIKSKDLLIQQYWDSTKTIRLKPGQKEATGIYYRPGYFRAKLLVNGKVIKEHDLFIKAEEWMATIDHEPVPAYLSKDELIVDDGFLSIAPSVLDIIKKFDKPLTMTYHLVKPFEGLQSDNFTLKASIKNTWGQGPAVCKTTKIFILCTKGAFIIPFTIPGCVSDINLKLNEKYLEGKSNDLSAFGTDITDWSDVKIEVKNRKVRILLNDKLLYEDAYVEDAGEVVGLRFSFLGAGAVKDIRFN